MADVEVAVKSDGTLLGLEAQVVADIGAYFVGTTGIPPFNILHRTLGPYRTPVVHLEVVGVITNKPTASPYRGAGGPEGAFFMERTLDLMTTELGLDPAEVRRINLTLPQSFPYTTPTGYIYDSGNFEPILDRVLELADHSGLRQQQQERGPQDPSWASGSPPS